MSRSEKVKSTSSCNKHSLYCRQLLRSDSCENENGQFAKIIDDQAEFWSSIICLEKILIINVKYKRINKKK